MKKERLFWVAEMLVLCLYKTLLDFVFMPVHYTVFEYMTGSSYLFSSFKFGISSVMFIVFLLMLADVFCSRKNVFCVTITLLYVFCIIPSLTLYAFLDNIENSLIVEPAVFWFIFVQCMKFFSLRNKEERKNETKLMIKRAEFGPNKALILLLICSLIALGCWSWAGFPLISSLSQTNDQRMALRGDSMPTIMNYVFLLLGGVGFPYLVAYFLDKKRFFLAGVCLLEGYLLFSINGMKTWLFLYGFVAIIFVGCKIVKNNMRILSICIPVGISLILVVSILLYKSRGTVSLVSQFGRVFCIPAGIGYKSVRFFRNNELLYLRESILRKFFETPYVGGSDFYINYGENSTLISSRANNGLWGDAYRNFGMFGIVIYPLLISSVLSFLQKSMKGCSERVTVVVMLIAVWNAINTSFFTWLLTGGIIVLWMMNVFFKKRKEDVVTNANNIKECNG